MAQIKLHYSAEEIDIALGKIFDLIKYIQGDIVQLYDNSEAVYPITKAEAVLFDNEINLVTKLEAISQQTSELVNETKIELEGEIADLQNQTEEKIEDLQNQIDTIEIGGVALKQDFGESEYQGISQKVLTRAINKIWQKIEDITGEALQGINLIVTPKYFIGENGTNVSITANTVDANGIFEHIEFSINGIVICQADNVDIFNYETEISETSIIKVVAKILGIEYTRQQIVTHYNSFWLGCGSVYTDVMDGTPDHIIPISNNMRGQYNITAKNGDHIFVIVGESLVEGFIRADINGVEIPFIINQETGKNYDVVTIDDVRYCVFTSENTYIADTYNIDING